jgi:Holliday junction resolvase RusA-like endonuclease
VILRCEFHLKGYRRADLDNLVKLVADGLNGVAWTDDRLVGELYAVAYDQSVNPRTIITVIGT